MASIDLDLSALQHKIELALAASYTALETGTVTPVDADSPSLKHTVFSIVEVIQKLDELKREYRWFESKYSGHV